MVNSGAPNSSTKCSFTLAADSADRTSFGWVPNTAIDRAPFLADDERDVLGADLGGGDVARTRGGWIKRLPVRHLVLVEILDQRRGRAIARGRLGEPEGVALAYPWRLLRAGEQRL